MNRLRSPWSIPLTAALAIIGASGPGCGQSTTSGQEDATPKFLSQVAGSRLQWGKDNLTFSGDRSFEYLFNPAVRYFPRRPSADAPAPREADAFCSLRIVGQATYVDNLASRSGEQWVDLGISEVQVISASISREDEATPPPREVCARYARALKRRTVRATVSEYAPDHVSFLQLSFDIPSKKGDKLATRNSTFVASSISSLNTSPGSRQHFTREGRPIDVTATAMAELPGTYAQGPLEITIDRKFNELVVTHHGCGVRYALGIAKIATAGDALTLNGKIIKSWNFTPDATGPEPAEDFCSAFAASLEAFPSTGLSFDYSLWLTPSREAGNLTLSFGHPPVALVTLVRQAH